jgi:NAD(P)-dependent dehydrogenase (short-subunit alcohol dehydrogenase family)
MTELDLTTRTVLITGATSGIGRITATQLAARGAHVLIVGRDESKGQQAATEINAQSQGGKVTFLSADLSDLSAVRDLAQRVLNEYPQLDTLVNNAAGFFPVKDLSPEGQEKTLVLTHLAPFLLTQLLLPHLLAQPQGRVISVLSGMYRYGKLDAATLLPPEPYVAMDLYSAAKLALLLTTLELARRTSDSSLLVLVADPGMASTGGLLDSLQPGVMNQNRGYAQTMSFILRFFPKNAEWAARSSVHTIAAPGLTSGSYWNSLFAFRFSSTPTATARDSELARQVWETSTRLVSTYLPPSVEAPQSIETD